MRAVWLAIVAVGSLGGINTAMAGQPNAQLQKYAEVMAICANAVIPVIDDRVSSADIISEAVWDMCFTDVAADLFRKGTRKESADYRLGYIRGQKAAFTRRVLEHRARQQ